MANQNHLYDLPCFYFVSKYETRDNQIAAYCSMAGYFGLEEQEALDSINGYVQLGLFGGEPFSEDELLSIPKDKRLQWFSAHPRGCANITKMPCAINHNITERCCGICEYSRNYKNYNRLVEIDLLSYMLKDRELCSRVSADFFRTLATGSMKNNVIAGPPFRVTKYIFMYIASGGNLDEPAELYNSIEAAMKAELGEADRHYIEQTTLAYIRKIQNAKPDYAPEYLIDRLEHAKHTRKKVVLPTADGEEKTSSKIPSAQNSFFEDTKKREEAEESIVERERQDVAERAKAAVKKGKSKSSKAVDEMAPPEIFETVAIQNDEPKKTDVLPENDVENTSVGSEEVNDGVKASGENVEPVQEETITQSAEVSEVQADENIPPEVNEEIITTVRDPEVPASSDVEEVGVSLSDVLEDVTGEVSVSYSPTPEDVVGDDTPEIPEGYTEPVPDTSSEPDNEVRAESEGEEAAAPVEDLSQEEAEATLESIELAFPETPLPCHHTCDACRFPVRFDEITDTLNERKTQFLNYCSKKTEIRDSFSDLAGAFGCGLVRHETCADFCPYNTPVVLGDYLSDVVLDVSDGHKALFDDFIIDMCKSEHVSVEVAVRDEIAGLLFYIQGKFYFFNHKFGYMGMLKTVLADTSRKRHYYSTSPIPVYDIFNQMGLYDIRIESVSALASVVKGLKSLMPFSLIFKEFIPENTYSCDLMMYAMRVYQKAYESFLPLLNENAATIYTEGKRLELALGRNVHLDHISDINRNVIGGNFLQFHFEVSNLKGMNIFTETGTMFKLVLTDRAIIVTEDLARMKRFFLKTCGDLYQPKSTFLESSRLIFVNDGKVVFYVTEDVNAFYDNLLRLARKNYTNIFGEKIPRFDVIRTDFYEP